MFDPLDGLRQKFRDGKPRRIRKSHGAGAGSYEDMKYCWKS